MAEIRRYSISDALAAAGVPEHSPVGHAARSLDAVKKAAVALDQLVNRSAEHTRRGHAPDIDTTKANESDIGHAIQQSEVLRVGRLVVIAMANGVATQLGLDPVPGPDDELQARVADLEARLADLGAKLVESEARLAESEANQKKRPRKGGRAPASPAEGDDPAPSDAEGDDAEPDPTEPEPQ